MPKIFLIKNRLHQQQLRLESQNAGNVKNDLLIGDNQPLSLIVHKKDGKDKSHVIQDNAGNFSINLFSATGVIVKIIINFLRNLDINLK